MAVETLPAREQVHVSGLVERTRRLQCDNDRLEQELERLGETNVELAFQLVEMEKRVRAAADLQIDRFSQVKADYQARVDDLERQLRHREERIRELEAILARTGPVPAPPRDAALRLVAGRLEPLLGASALHLVERVFQRAEVSPDCSRAEIEPALSKLEEAAGRLLADPGRASELKQALEELRAELASTTEPAAPQIMARMLRRRRLPVDDARPARLRASFAPVPKMPQPEAVVPEPVWTPPEAGEARVPTLAPEVEAPSAARPPAPEPAARSAAATIAESGARILASIAADPTVFGPEPGRFPSGSDEPWSYGDEPSEDEPLRTDFDPELGRGVALAREQVNAADYALALETILPLRASYPHSLEAAELHFLALAGLRRHGEALDLGRRLAAQCRHYEPFVDAFTRVLEDTHGKSACERKQALLDLVELHLEDRQRALGYLKQAELLPDMFPGGERLNFHAVNLLGGGRTDRRPYLLAYMGWLDRAEVFEHLWQVYNEPRSAHEASSARAIVALGKVSRKLAENSEKQARLLARETLSELPPNGELEETACVRFLNQLCERASLGPARPSTAFLRRMLAGQTPKPGWVNLPEATLFGLTGVQLARYSGSEDFLIDAHGDASGLATLVVHEKLAGLPECEQAYLLHRALYQVARGHASLRHRRANLSVGHARRLVLACRNWLAERMPNLPEPSVDPLFDLRSLCLATRSHEAGYLLELLTSPHPFADILDRPADHFARRHSSLTGASYALLREHAPELLAQVEREGFRALYERPELRELRLRLQRMWAQPLEQSLKE